MVVDTFHLFGSILSVRPNHSPIYKTVVPNFAYGNETIGQMINIQNKMELLVRKL